MRKRVQASHVPIFPKGIFKIRDHEGNEHLAEFIGRQRGFECIICGYGNNCYTFNIFDSKEAYDQGNYETWGYGQDHLHRIHVISENNQEE